MWRLFGALLVVLGFGLAQPRVVRVEVVALEEPLFYNRFGSVNPYGMIYALKHQVERIPGGKSERVPGLMCPGYARLKPGVRPRPLAIRANQGDILEITLENWLSPTPPDLSRCRPIPGKPSPYSNLLREATLGEQGANWPRTRLVNLMIPGLQSVNERGEPSGLEPRCTGLAALPPGGRVTCYWRVPLPQPDPTHLGSAYLAAGAKLPTHLFFSQAAPAGGEGDGGSLVHGLFGTVNVEPQHSAWYRSQVTAGDLDQAWRPAPNPLDGGPALRPKALNYEALHPAPDPHRGIRAGDPVLRLTRPGSCSYRGARRECLELVYGDVTAVIWEGRLARTAAEQQSVAARLKGNPPAFREFTAVFHDELKTFYADAFTELARFPQLAGVRDGFAINYGASGMGSILIANRKGIGPSARCVDCFYEEFFLQSWANGDPALLEQYPEDPANVYHSYLNDRVEFRNLHAGPKETHVFHLHAHQWLSTGNENVGTYLDSQTIAPLQGFSYGIYHGGLKGWGQTDHHQAQGSGNRNRTPGDSIFHCHLYPHFAQGMWSLWRVHDVLEDGSRTLPDGQSRPGLSLAPLGGPARPGTDPYTGQRGPGTPIPALVPLPEQALPPLPTYGPEGFPGYPFYIPGRAGHRAPQPPLDFRYEDGRFSDAGLPRHLVLGGERGLAGLSAEQVKSLHRTDPVKRGTAALARALALADMSAELETARIQLLDNLGEPLERRAMLFHAGGQLAGSPLEGAPIRLTLQAADGRVLRQVNGQPRSGWSAGYAMPQANTPERSLFSVNGAPPKPGAPFADPCGAPGSDEANPVVYRPEDGLRALKTIDPWARKDYFADPALRGFRQYQVSVVQLELVVNKAGWHDPQARINVLSDYAEAVEGKRRADQEPFFFRAESGECVSFFHTNRAPKELHRDDFQVKTPTDTIGQHIHLVKFDVLASDGSANGFNYEDGTFAPEAVHERKCAANRTGGAWVGPTRRMLPLDAPCRGDPGAIQKTLWKKNAFQTTVQRWFADPLITQGRMPYLADPNPHQQHQPQAKDRTLRTVFTHDHFAPSSIQQHGFYSALLVEPAGTQWQASDRGQNREHVEKAARNMQAFHLDPTRLPSLGREFLPLTEPIPLQKAPLQEQPIGSRALITGALDDQTHPDHREFALAVADFALLYDHSANPRPQQGLHRLLCEAEPRFSLGCRQAYPELARTPKGELPGQTLNRPFDRALVQTLEREARALWQKHGAPVAPPEKPEAISTDHHDPYLINYRHEPLALRLGHVRPGQSAKAAFEPELTRCGAALGPENLRQERSWRHLRAGRFGDPAFVFSTPFHGDPCTPLLEAYEGEQVQIRLIQGAQEVQHMFALEGLHWKRVVDLDLRGELAEPLPGSPADAAYLERWRRYLGWLASRDNPEGRIAAQEIGISEHFEMQLPAFSNVDAGLGALDYLYHFGTLDALWNGAWGLLRTYNGTTALDPSRCANFGPEELLTWRQVLFKPALAALCRDTEGGRPTIGQRLNPLPRNPQGRLQLTNGGRFGLLNPEGLPCTESTPFGAVAVRVERLQRLLNKPGLSLYDRASGLLDPDALVMLPLHPAQYAKLRSEPSWPTLEAALREQYANLERLEPFVLRVNAGECAALEIYNALLGPDDEAFRLPEQPGLPNRSDSRPQAFNQQRPSFLPDRVGDAELPRIVPLNVPGNHLNPLNLRPSSEIAFSIPVVYTRPGSHMVGVNTRRWVDNAWPRGANRNVLGSFRLEFYAGLLEQGRGLRDTNGQPICGPEETCLRAVPYAFGALPIKPLGDVLGHGVHGLLGMVVVEPQQAIVLNPQNRRVPLAERHLQGLSARVLYPGPGGWRSFRELALVYQDGLNLHQARPDGRTTPLPDCRVCDDSYDLGEKGLNYRSAPLWARLNPSLGPLTDLNTQSLPPGFFRPAYKPLPTSTFVANPGEQLVLRVVQPVGRARQRTLVLSGYGYEDMLPEFGSPHSALVSVGKGLSAWLQEPAYPGCFLYRDGPTLMLSSGVWGLLVVRNPDGSLPWCAQSRPQNP
ncbi:MAG: hypothetical protein K6T57_11715 [Thermaceae bacterium]|nr:hypothetical protein [Thermaceae bacterium]